MGIDTEGVPKNQIDSLIVIVAAKKVVSFINKQFYTICVPTHIVSYRDIYVRKCNNIGFFNFSA